MNSPFANIFLSLQQQVQAQVPAIVYIDQDMGQLYTDRSNTRPQVAWPCLLIDFENFKFGNMGTDVQTAEGTILLRLGFAPSSSSTATTPGAYTQKAISYYDIEWALHKALQGYSPGTDVGSLTRTSTITQRRTDTIRVRELRYSIAFQDYSAKPALQTVAATIIAHAEIDLIQ